MLEWKTIKLEGRTFIGMHMILPKQGLYLITSTKCILAGNLFDIQHLSPSSAVFIMEKSKSFSDLLTSKVIAMNECANKQHYQLGMSGKEVLLYQSTTSNQTKI